MISQYLINVKILEFIVFERESQLFDFCFQFSQKVESARWRHSDLLHRRRQLDRTFERLHGFLYGGISDDQSLFGTDGGEQEFPQRFWG